MFEPLVAPAVSAAGGWERRFPLPPANRIEAGSKTAGLQRPARPAVGSDAKVFYPAAEAEVPVLVGWLKSNYPDLTLEHTPLPVAGLVRDFGNHQRTGDEGARLEGYGGKAMEAIARQIGSHGFNGCI